MEQSTFDQIRTRPRFKLFTEMNKEDYTLHLKNYVKIHEKLYKANINTEAALIWIGTTEDNYWKPFLALRTEFDGEEKKTCIRGVFGPSSAVWTFFIFIYVFLSIAWMVSITLFFVAKQIKHDGFGWALPTSMFVLLLIFVTYVAGRIGRKKAQIQMEKLRSFAIESTLHLESKKINSVP